MAKTPNIKATFQEVRTVEINGGRVDSDPSGRIRLTIPAGTHGYADAQIDDCSGHNRRRFAWQPEVELVIRARFSHGVGALQGTAGFGFWNAPFGPGTSLLPALPQAIWFFYASEPTDLPLPADDGPGRGWFASTIDAGTWRALAWSPFALPVLLLNQFPFLRARLWPVLRHSLGISFANLDAPMTDWHTYSLSWRPNGSAFFIDDVPVFRSDYWPRGPLCFVCWLDNQFLVATRRGRIRAGTLPVGEEQWMEIEQMNLSGRESPP